VTRRRKLVQLLLVASVALVTLGADLDRARFEKLGHEMVCTCGCNQILLECNHVGCPASDGMRNELTAAMNSGKNDADLLGVFVAKYGPTVLAAPTTTGFNLAAWVMPFVLLLAGLTTVVLLVRNWRFRPAGVAAVPAGTADTGRYREQVREETEL